MQEFLQQLETHDLFGGRFKYKAVSLERDFPLDPIQAFHKYMFRQLEPGEAGYGGYMEKRTVYAHSPVFRDREKGARNIHLGVDYWVPAGTLVCAPLAGQVVGAEHLAGTGNYGGTMILKHAEQNHIFYSLYGHLDIDTVTVEAGQQVEGGEVLAAIGAAKTNGGWPPHLHFQLIRKLDESVIDYPGVCFEEEMKLYGENCPDPRWLLHTVKQG